MPKIGIVGPQDRFIAARCFFNLQLLSTLKKPGNLARVEIAALTSLHKST